MVPRTLQDPPQNSLLASLSDADYEQLRPHLGPVCLDYKRSLYEVNKPIEFVYFLEQEVLMWPVTDHLRALRSGHAVT
jgi:hypothetical protein